MVVIVVVLLVVVLLLFRVAVLLLVVVLLLLAQGRLQRTPHCTWLCIFSGSPKTLLDAQDYL